MSRCIDCIFLGMIIDISNDMAIDHCMDAHNIESPKLPYNPEEEQDCPYFVG